MLDKVSGDLFVQLSGLVHYVGENQCVLAEHDKFTKGWTSGKNIK